MKLLVATLFAAFLAGRGQAQWAKPVEGYDAIAHQKNAMKVLGAWSLASLAAGVPMAFSSDHFARDFGYQNIAWGAIDGAIAGFGYRGAMRKQLSNASLEYDLLNAVEQAKFARVLKINAILDVGYVAVGSGLLLSRKENLRGHGAGVLTQGAFLLLFDGINYFIAKRHRRHIPVENFE